MRIARGSIALTSVLAFSGVLVAMVVPQPVIAQGAGPVPPAPVPNVPSMMSAAPGAAGNGIAPAVAVITKGADATATAVPASTPAVVSMAAALPGGTDDVTAADAALQMANMLDGAGGGISGQEALQALEDAAAAGQPMAMWRLGTMYENGDGVRKDPVKAFAYFSRIANDHADAAPKSLEADIVAQSFVKMGEYYSEGLPDAGIPVDLARSRALLLHAATYFGDADAQYRVGEMYLDPKQGNNPLQGARWLALAAHKGHAAAQAKLGDMLFNGEGIPAQPVEGLMWLTLAHEHTVGTTDEDWITDLLNRAISAATPDERKKAIKMADNYDPLTHHH